MTSSARRGLQHGVERPASPSRQTSARFSDKEAVWATTPGRAPFFGNVYIFCNAAQFRGNGNGFTNHLDLLTSVTRRLVEPAPGHAATNNIHSRNGFGRSGCTVRTDSHGVVYVFDFQFGFSPTDGGRGPDPDDPLLRRRRALVAPAEHLHRLRHLQSVRAIDRPLRRDGRGRRAERPLARPVGRHRQRAPSGTDASNRIVLTVGRRACGLNHEHVMFTTSTSPGTSWTPPTAVERSGDRGYYSAPAISPNGTDVWLVYNAFTSRSRTARGPANDRPLVGQVLHATARAVPWRVLSAHRGAPGDARGSSQNDLAAEFLGDYVYAAATRSYGMSVWNDVRNAADCPAIDEYRQDLHDEAVATGQQTAEAEEPRGESEEGEDPAAGPVAPDVQQVCPATFGNSDIYGWSSLAAP
jgi:hypothetical protein